MNELNQVEDEKNALKRDDFSSKTGSQTNEFPRSSEAIRLGNHFRNRRQKRSRVFKSDGGRNLAILGIVTTLIAVVLTGFSLLIYHNSGDIYLDRSRPGFLPDEEEIDQSEDPVDEYNFQQNGGLTVEILDEYLQNLDLELKTLDDYSDPFGADALSDQTLGL